MSAKDFIQFRSPELATNVNVDNFISLADSRTSKTAFGDTAVGTLGTIRDYAVALRAMHLMEKSSDSGGSAGIVQSEREGDLSRSYQVSPALAKKYPDLMSTQWGRELAEMIDSSMMPILTRRISG
jgi:hypothetical protein